MEDLKKIKDLEVQFSSDLEKAKKEAELKVEEAKASRRDLIDLAVKQAEAEVEKRIDESTFKADAEAKTILVAADADVVELRKKHSMNSQKAVEFVLGELGV